MVSLDISRKNLAICGSQIFEKVCGLAQYARDEINDIGDYYAYSRELCNGDSIYDFDPTKLSVHTIDVGLAGIEVYDILRDEYDIQVEFGDVANILAYISVGDRERDIERLVSALAEIRRLRRRSKAGMMAIEYLSPEVAATPQEAFYAETEALPIECSAGHICAESVMCYPPGIPILAPGERITPDIIRYIRYMKDKGGSLTGLEDINIERINVLKGGR
jgi:arginine/lysine/ornithine decarboxylase